MICPRCGVEFENRPQHRKKFCSEKCRTRYNAINRYNKLKNDSEYKKVKSERFKIWYQKNKVKHNLKMRIYMREYARKHYSKWARENKEKNGE